jgi:hypothetical protein
MSDGPHRTLNMSPCWKRVAEYADNKAYSLDEVAGAFLPALEQSCRDEVPDGVWRDLARIFGRPQQSLFGEQRVEEIAALRSQAAGLPLACALVDGAVRAASKGAVSEQSLVEVTTQALLNRGSRGNKQVEEHWYRKSTERRTDNVRDRLERALNKAALEPLARQRLNMGAGPKPARSRKRSDLDDGVNFNE